MSLRCQPTPYAYQYFSGVRGESRVLLCISCVNWQRRASGQIKRSGSANGKPWRRPLLFIDQFALFMLKPGTTTFPDQRCVLRLVKALQSAGDNWVPRLLLGLLPVPVQVMVASIRLGDLPESSMQNAMVQAWWEYNGRTAFFSHHLTAKLVRKVLKGEREGKQEVKEEEPAVACGEAGAAVGAVAL